MARKTIKCVVMFADVAGSTAMYQNLGDDLARERISKSLDALISISKRHKGNLVKTIGDEILVYFMDADMALTAARAIQEAMEDDRSPETIGVSIRIGMQYGSTILEDNDIFGDTVNVAARIASIAKARQILCTKELAFRIENEELIHRSRPFDRLRVKGRDDPVDIYMFNWEQESDVTNMATASSFTNPARHYQAKTLTLTCGKNKIEIPNTTTSFVLGRGSDCELVIQGELISRYHSKLEHRRGKFIISDQSTNGTFVKTRDGLEIFLRREEMALYGEGFISLGKKVDHTDIDLIHFSSV